jgi:hypothetical protein
MISLISGDMLRDFMRLVVVGENLFRLSSLNLLLHRKYNILLIITGIYYLKAYALTCTLEDTSSP